MLVRNCVVSPSFGRFHCLRDPRRLATRTMATHASAEQQQGLQPHSSPVQRPRRRGRVALFAPNLVCYARLLLLCGVVACGRNAPAACAWVYLLFASLDAVDGFLARKLHQTSSFGAALDVCVDNMGRSLLWVLSTAPPALAVAMPSLEWLTFCVTHSRATAGAAWKAGSFDGAPALLRWLVTRGMSAPQGKVMLLSLQLLPLAVFLRGAPPCGWLSKASTALFPALVVGRLCAAAVEVWLVGRHVSELLQADAETT